jgi:tetratricopeptide (TPR) repeat protein
MGVLYIYVFALIFTAIIVSTLERGRKKYGLGGANRISPLRDLNIFILAILLFGVTSLANAVLGAVLRPPAFVLLQVLLAGGALLFALVMEARYLSEARWYRSEMLVEIAALRKELDKDPLNAAYLERLSELYKKIGDMKAALSCAEKAYALDPDEPNRWKVENLKEPVLPELDISPFRALVTGYFRYLAGLLSVAVRLRRLK